MIFFLISHLVQRGLAAGSGFFAQGHSSKAKQMLTNFTMGIHTDSIMYACITLLATRQVSQMLYWLITTVHTHDFKASFL